MGWFKQRFDGIILVSNLDLWIVLPKLMHICRLSRCFELYFFMSLYSTYDLLPAMYTTCIEKLSTSVME